MKNIFLFLVGFFSLIPTICFADGMPVVVCQSQSSSLQFYQLPYPHMIETVSLKSENFSLSGLPAQDLLAFFKTGSTAILSISIDGQNAYTMTHKNGAPTLTTLRTGWEVKYKCTLPDGRVAFTPPTSPGNVNICDRGMIAEAIIKSQGFSGYSCENFPAQKLKEVYGLSIENKDFNELPKNAFEGLSNLAALTIRSNQFTLHDDDLISVPKLKSLNINSELQYINSQVFKELTQLEDLNIKLSRAAIVHDDLFEGLKSLLRLDIGGHVELPRDLLKPLTKLQGLRIHDNDLFSLDDPSFLPMGQMDSLVLENLQGLKKLPAIPRTRSLILSGLKVQIPNAHLAEKRIERLMLIGSSLELSEGWFEGLSDLTEIYIYDVQIKKIDPETFHGSPLLKGIVIRGTNIEQIPPQLFSGLKSLNWLDLSKNKLKSLPVDLFKDLNSLVSINLQYNELQTHYLFWKAFRLLPALKYASLNWNNIDSFYELKDILQGSPELKKFCIGRQKPDRRVEDYKYDDLKKKFPQVEFGYFCSIQ